MKKTPDVKSVLGRRPGQNGSPITGRGDRGQAVLELALVTPFLLIMLVGAVQIGILAYGAIEVSNAASAGAIYGAQNHANAADNTGITNAAINDAANVTSLTAAGVTVHQWCACETGVTAASVGGAVSCATFSVASCVSPSRIVEWVQVDTQATVVPSFSVTHVPFTLHGHATMRVGQ